jgi:hypothetical protein
MTQIMDNRLIAKLARKHGPRLVEHALQRLLPEQAGAEQPGGAAVTPKLAPRKPSLTGRIANFALLRVATRSVPGAILVGGGLIAKALHDQHKAKQAQRIAMALRNRRF